MQANIPPPPDFILSSCWASNLNSLAENRNEIGKEADSSQLFEDVPLQWYSKLNETEYWMKLKIDNESMRVNVCSLRCVD